jgi:shikimate kinase
MRARIVLIGPRGAGKSTVGPILAARLGVSFLDTDRLVEEEAGRPLGELWARGEFRAREREVLRRVLTGAPAVVAVGGGAVLWDGFAGAARGWTVIWLDAEPDVLRRRIEADPSARPSLTGQPPAEEIAEVRRAREPLYAAVAWRRVATDRLAPDTLADGIAELVRTRARRAAD